jgi:hypothetical protein
LIAGLLIAGPLSGVIKMGEPASSRIRVAALSFDTPAGWRSVEGSITEIGAALTAAGVDGTTSALDDLGVSRETRVLLFHIRDGAVDQVVRIDFLQMAGMANPIGIRDAALLSVGINGAADLELFDGVGGAESPYTEIPYAGYRAGSGLARRSVVFSSFPDGIVRLTILAPDTVAALLIGTLQYDPPPAPEGSPGASAEPESSPSLPLP